MSSERFSPLVERLHGKAARGWEVHSRATEAIRAGEEGVVVLSIGDPDFATPEPIVDSAVAALRSGDTHYAKINGRLELREAIASDLTQRLGPPFGPDNVVVTAGTQNALFSTLLCIAGPGDEVIALEPMYLTYESTVTAGGADLVRVAQPGPGFRPDFAAIEAAITPRTKAILITNPNNPTGVVMTEAELAELASLAIAHDLWVISDEVYAELVFAHGGTRAPSILSVPRMTDRAVVVSGLSKSHAMTGWRVGWAVGPEDLMRHVHALQVNINYGVSGFVQQAALDALTRFRSTADDMRSTYQRRRDLAAEILSDVDALTVLVPEAGMYLMVDVSEVADTAMQFCSDLFDAKRVSVLDASAFGESASGWVRLSFTTSDEDLAEGCRSIAAFVRERGSLA